MIFDFDVVWESLPVLITAAGTTIQLTVCNFASGRAPGAACRARECQRQPRARFPVRGPIS